MARQVKNRLERLDKINEQSLSRKVRLTGASAQSVVFMHARAGLTHTYCRFESAATVLNEYHSHQHPMYEGGSPNVSAWHV